MTLEEITISNYKTFRNVTFTSIRKMCVVVGANGCGKTTFFDVFGFLKDALLYNVTIALNKRGGFKEVVSRGYENENISFEIKFRSTENRLVTYKLEIALANDVVTVAREVLRFRRGSRGKPWHFLDFSNGTGTAITNEDEYDRADTTEMKREQHTLDSADILAIKGIGQFSKFKIVSMFRKTIEQWQVSDFHITEARKIQDEGIAQHLSEQGENLPQVTKYIYQNYPDIFENILLKMSERVPGVTKVEAKSTEDGRIVLRFQDGNFKDPFYAKFVSDGTIKMFAYLMLLYDPIPHNLLCVEEPENQLYPQLMLELAEEFKLYAMRGGQIFVSTHSPDFLNGVNLDEIFWLEKRDGFTIVHKASEYRELRNLVDVGDKPGTLWKQRLFIGANL